MTSHHLQLQSYQIANQPREAAAAAQRLLREQPMDELAHFAGHLRGQRAQRDRHGLLMLTQDIGDRFTLKWQ
jgi:hypothetical protein